MINWNVSGKKKRFNDIIQFEEKNLVKITRKQNNVHNSSFQMVNQSETNQIEFFFKNFFFFVECVCAVE